MPATSRALSLLVACSVVATVSCGDLLKKLKNEDADSGPADAAATAAAAASAAPSATTAASAPATANMPTNEVKLPGACIDPKVDVKKRKQGAFTLDDSMDLDGDGNNDRIYTQVVEVYVGKFIFHFLYVMRGACGHFVGDTGGTQGWKPTGMNSQGLKSFELTYAGQCESGCDCVTRTAPFIFNGTKYVEGKPGHDIIVKPCGASKDAGTAANGAGTDKVGDKLTVECRARGEAGLVELALHWDRNTATGTLAAGGKSRPVIGELYKGLVLVDAPGTSPVTGKIATVTTEGKKTIRLGDYKQPTFDCL